MITIAEYKSKYPLYADMSDKEVADLLHEKFYKDVPRDQFYKEHGVEVPRETAPKENSFGQKLWNIAGSGLAGAAEFGQGIHNAPRNLANAIYTPAANYTPNPTNIDFQNEFGVKNPGTFSNLIKQGVQYAPYAMSGGLGALRQGLSGLVSGLTQSENPLTAAPAEALTGALGGGILKALSKGPGALDFMRPGKQAQSILKELGAGRTPDQNIESMIGDVNTKRLEKKIESKALYGPVFNEAGKYNIYGAPLALAEKQAKPVSFRLAGEEMKPDSKLAGRLGLTKAPIEPVKGSAYEALPKDVFEDIDRPIKKMHDAFVKDPTLNNAHEFQSQLGYEIRKLQKSDDKGMLDQLGRNSLSKYKEIQEALQFDADKFLENKFPHLKNRYKEATEHYATEYMPHKRLKSVYNAGIGNPVTKASFINSFKDTALNSDAEKVIEDLGQKFRNKILHQKLFQGGNKINANKLIENFDNLHEQGFYSHVSPRLESQIQNLRKARLAKRIGTGIGAGSTLAVFPGIRHKVGAFIP